MRAGDLLHLLRTRLRELALELRDRPERLVVYALAVVGGAVTVKEAYDAFGAPVVGVVGATMAALLALVVRHRPRVSGPLPAGEVSPVCYQLHLPPGVDVVRTTIQKSQKVFHADAIDPDEDLEYFLADPYSMVALTNSDGHCLGFIDFYFFDRASFDLYLRGERAFDELLHDGLLAHPQARRADVVYVGTHLHFGYATDGEDFWRSRENALLVWGAAHLLLRHQHFGDDGLDMYSTAWSPEGAGVLRHFYFRDCSREVPARGGRLGDKPLYRRLHVTPQDLRVSVQRFDELAAHHCELIVDGKNIGRPTGAGPVSPLPGAVGAAGGLGGSGAPAREQRQST